MKNPITAIEGMFASAFTPAHLQAAKHDILVILSFLPTAKKYIDILTPVIAAVNPIAAAEVAGVSAFIGKYPDLFSTAASSDQKKVAALAIATDLVKAENPALSTAVARAAVQLGTVPSIVAAAVPEAK